jgi:starch phosphorylase
MQTIQAGERDLERAAEALASRLPETLAPLARVAYDYAWSWHPDGPAVFEAVDPDRWHVCHFNPVRLLQEASGAGVRRAAQDEELLGRAGALEQALREHREQPAAPSVATPEHPIAYFCAEYGVHASLPVYSGGLGALAGDLVKEASDRRVPLVAVGLMYRQGYFRQRIDHSGWQQEYWTDTDPHRVPAALVTGDGGEPVTVSVPVRDEVIVAQAWRVDVGRVPLFLLDSDRPENSAFGRWTTSQLYIGDPALRLAQYALLGLGGMRLLDTLGIEPSVIHLNEGHAAFAALEAAEGRGVDDAVAAARRRTVFTTHTPVPAGNDAYPASEVADVLARLASERGLDLDAVLALGRTHPEDDREPFGITQLALRTARGTNGVSERHGAVAREMWVDVWPGTKTADVPITHVTNGVHVPTWVGRPIRRLFDEHLGGDWLERAPDPEAWARVDDIPAADLWAARREQRLALVDYLRRRGATDRLWRAEAREYVDAAERAFDPDVLTLGFARRVATYKRLWLLVADPDRALGLLDGDRPIQLVIAGKAHPRDDEGKHLIQQLLRLRGAPNVADRVVFLQDYDLAMAAQLVQGCDVWVNLPRAPMEASGTSGMKSAVNGGLQLSVADGWWAEAYDGENGWALSGEVDPDQQAQDARDAHDLYRLLEEEVIPSFYDVDGDGLPTSWLQRMRASLRTNAPRYTAARMLADYEEKLYR